MAKRKRKKERKKKPKTKQKTTGQAQDLPWNTFDFSFSCLAFLFSIYGNYLTKGSSLVLNTSYKAIDSRSERGDHFHFG